MKKIVIFFIMLLCFSYTQASWPCEGLKTWYDKRDWTVYYYELWDSCHWCKSWIKSYLLDWVDTETFEVLVDPSEMKKKRLWWITCLYPYWKDKNNVYYKWGKILGLKPKWFFLDETFNINWYKLELAQRKTSSYFANLYKIY